MKGKLAFAFCAAVGVLGAVSAQAKNEMSDKVAAKLAGFESTGETTSCLSTTQIRSINALDDWRFLVRANGGDYYLNEVSNRCSGAARGNNRLQYTMSGSQLCRNQIITIVDNSSGMTVGSCGLGSFEKLEKAPAE
ncbi:hypothetical protein [Hyphococcus sp.]|uniref:hypothetical protein n=1 Tax=Hyphococcus sp. TaxID=2038636 RepID=UPI00208A5CE2|nr:MAG: hypothetical protein DHS20C04_26050 [Marinicaulis sp.]